MREPAPRTAIPLHVARCLLVALVVIAWFPHSAQADVSTAAARAGVQSQVDAWNRGDLEGALAGYLDDPSMTWVNAQGVSRGFVDFAAGMRAQFGADPASMGRYSAEVLHERALTRSSALLVVRWRIDRDGRRLFGGVSTQLWERRGKRWVCVLEHAT